MEAPSVGASRINDNSVFMVEGMALAVPVSSLNYPGFSPGPPRLNPPLRFARVRRLNPDASTEVEYFEFHRTPSSVVNKPFRVSSNFVLPI